MESPLGMVSILKGLALGLIGSKYMMNGVQRGKGCDTCNWRGLGRARFTRIKNGAAREHSRERSQHVGRP